MPPKRNPFACFVHEYQKRERRNGRPVSNFGELCKMLGPVWSCMSQEEKLKYKVLAKGSVGSLEEENSVNKHIMYQNYLKIDNIRTKNKLTELFRYMEKDELMNKKFFLLHVNSQSHMQEQYYFPAEIAILEFTLAGGITRTYHHLIGFHGNRRGLAGGMRDHSDKFHQINCWDKHPDDYKRICLDLIRFLKNEERDSDSIDHTLELPDMYTIEQEVGGHLTSTKSSMLELYQTAFPDYDAMDSEPIFSIGSVNQLLLEMEIKFDDHWKLRDPIIAPRKLLEFGFYGANLGCDYHRNRGIEFQCSKARVVQWLSNLCKHVADHGTRFFIRPGRHYACFLDDGNYTIENNDTAPVDDPKSKSPKDENELKDGTKDTPLESSSASSIDNNDTAPSAVDDLKSKSPKDENELNDGTKDTPLESSSASSIENNDNNTLPAIHELKLNGPEDENELKDGTKDTAFEESSASSVQYS